MFRVKRKETVVFLRKCDSIFRRAVSDNPVNCLKPEWGEQAVRAFLCNKKVAEALPKTAASAMLTTSPNLAMWYRPLCSSPFFSWMLNLTPKRQLRSSLKPCRCVVCSLRHSCRNAVLFQCRNPRKSRNRVCKRRRINGCFNQIYDKILSVYHTYGIYDIGAKMALYSIILQILLLICLLDLLFLNRGILGFTFRFLLQNFMVKNVIFIIDFAVKNNLLCDKFYCRFFSVSHEGLCHL